MKPLFSLSGGRPFGAVLLTCLAVLALVACSDNGSNRRKPAAAGYLQFYNASPNSSATDFVTTTTTSATNSSFVSTAEFGDATAITAFTPAEYVLTFERTDPSNPGAKIEMFERDITIVKDEYSFWLMSGDFSAPSLTEYRYAPPKSYKSGELGVTVFNVTEGRGQIELYYVAEGGSFDDALFFATLGDGGQSEPTTLKQGNYTFFAVDVDSGNRILTTATIPFAKAKTYFLMLREVGFGDGSTIVLDQVTGSNFVYSYPDQLNPMPAKVRAYNSIGDLSNVDVVLTGESQTDTIANLMPSILSDTQSLTGGDFDIALTTASDPNSVHVLKEDTAIAPGSSSVLFFLDNLLESDDTKALRAFLIPRSQRVRLYEANVNYFNLALKQVPVETSTGTVLQHDLLTLHFVNEDAGEIFDKIDDEGNLVIAPTAKYKLQQLAFGSQRNFSLLTANYVLYLTYSTTVDTVKTLHQFGDSLAFSVQAGENYLLTLEADASATDGYRLKIAQ